MIPGTPYDQIAYRSELRGKLGITSFTSSIILLQGFNPRVVTYCDGLAALNKVDLTKQNLRVTSKHIDLISIISEIWSKSTFVSKNIYVYGHQDKLTLPLTVLENLNCKMDIMANK